MKISDFIFEYRSKGKSEICRVRVFVSQAGLVTGLATDLSEASFGQSVTNSIEDIWSALVFDGHIASDASVIEHYEGDRYTDESFDLVKLASKNSPTWIKRTKAQVVELIESDPDEFSTISLEVPRLFERVEKYRQNNDPFMGSPFLEQPNVIVRRLEIEQGMVTYAELYDLICSGANEQQIQKTIKCDLSLIGEVYSKPEDEYISFSEYPVGDGFVDFVLFSGRSRMDITLVEIKGANYNLVTSGSYKNFSAKCNESVQQIRGRLRQIYENYDDFRLEAHRVRQRVQAGHTLYNSYRGPKSELGVSSEKDVNIHTVVIGGRGKNDLEESKLRHEYEFSFSPSIRIESWDSWLKKLRRDA